MATTRVAPTLPARQSGSLSTWLLEDQPREMEGPYEPAQPNHQHPWWQVMCLTGVDYFSTLGYQPGIAALAAGVLSPIATLILVLLTLFGALPVYRRVARESPRGEGSIAMLERLLPWWQGKLFVLVLLGFVATDFIITITLSAADATAHVLENPFLPSILEGHQVAITLFLIAILGGVFLKGFKEAIGIAVALVIVYLALNAVIVVVSLQHVVANPSVLANWREALFTQHGSPIMMVAVALLVFPRLALGLSGFETGVAVMPLVKGDPGDTLDNPAGRIRNTQKLLTSAALIMSAFLMTTSFVTTLLIPHEEFEEGGEASGRALAYLAHEYLGDVFGTAYDISTILILWFAGASAMAGLLNIVPRYLPRYGMAPDWAHATRPLVLVFTLVAFAITTIFHADVEAQAGAYATGVLVLITSAAVAVTLAARKAQQRWLTGAFGVIALVFAYTTVVNIVERPDGIKIAAFFIAAIVIVSLISRAVRSTELRTSAVDFDETAERWIAEASPRGTMRFIANHPDERNTREYLLKERGEREASHIPLGDPIVFLEVTVRDASEFAAPVRVSGEEIGGFRVLRAEGTAVPNTLAAVLLAIRDRMRKPPHAYFGWAEGNPLKYLARFIFFGEGDIAPTTREILRKAEPNPAQRPVVHVG
ncbi:MAG: Amino acid transporter [Thermomicrobiales bacterium]|nr:Amino acid transporter [Thermomicrobiales bacterium]